MSFLSDLHKDLRGTRFTKRGATHRAEDVPRGTHKEYPRMERISLPAPEATTMSLSSALSARHSTVRESGTIPLSLQEMSTVLGHALQKHTARLNRNYPSGGALYPIETYIVATMLLDGKSGIYHYHPTAHALERLWGLPDTFSMRRLVERPEFLSPSVLILFTSVWERSSAKYGDLAYQHALLEAGHMSENVLLLATALGLDARPYAGFNDDMSTELLDLDEHTEQAVHSITLSKGATTRSHTSEAHE